MTALINCKCGYRTELECATSTEAEVIADRHESGDVRRAYRHATLITLYDGVREVVLT